jgi:hypothetical protein
MNVPMGMIFNNNNVGDITVGRLTADPELSQL